MTLLGRVVLPHSVPTATDSTIYGGPLLSAPYVLDRVFPAIVTASKVIVTANPSGVAVGTPFSLTVNAVDPSNTLAAGYSGSATVTRATGPGTLSGTTTASFSGGVLTFSNLLLNTIGTYTLTISSGSLTPATTASFSVGAAGTMTALPGTLTFRDAVGGTNPPQQSITITCSNPAQPWSISSSAGRLTATPSSGTGTATVIIHETTGALTASTYNDTLTVTATGATGSPATITVTFIVATVTTIINDDFAHAFGTANTGQTWTNRVSTITSSAGRTTMPNTSQATIEPGICDGTFAMSSYDGGTTDLYARWASTTRSTHATATPIFGTTPPTWSAQQLILEGDSFRFGGYSAPAWGDNLVAVSLRLNGWLNQLRHNGVVISQLTTPHRYKYTTAGIGGTIAGGGNVTGQGPFTVTDDVSGNNGATALPALVVFDGNSLTAGLGNHDSDRFVPKVMAQLPGYDYLDWGISGQTTAQIITAAPTKADRYYRGSPVRPACVAVLWEITNDLNANVGTTVTYNNVVTYCQARRAMGYKVVLLTCVPRGGSSDTTFEADRQTVNGNIRSNWKGSGGTSTTVQTNVFLLNSAGSGVFADVLVDIGNDANIGAPGAETNTTYFASDQTHLTVFAYGLLANMVYAGINALALPAPAGGTPIIAEDTFTRANEGPLVTSSANNTYYSNNLAVISNHGGSTFAANGFGKQGLVETNACDGRVEAIMSTLPSGSDYAGVMCRSDTAQNFILAIIDNAGLIRLYTVAGGSVYTLLNSTTVTLTTPLTLAIDFDGAKIQVLYNGSVVSALTSYSDFGQENTEHGLLADGTSTRYSRMRVYATPPTGVSSVLTTNVSSLSFAGTTTTSPASQLLAINFAGASTPWTIGSSDSRMTVNKAVGAGSWGTQVSINTVGLSAGTYTYTLTITAPGATNSPKAITVTTTVTGATATHLSFSQQPIATGKTIAFTTMPKVQALLAGGGVDTAYTANVTLGITSGSGGTAGAGATLSGTVTVAAVAGVADFTSAGLSLNQGGTAYQLHATSGALTAADSSAFDVASVFADFNGADSSTLLINPATGQAWTAQVGAFKNISNQAKLDSGSEGQATVSAGSATGYTQVTIVNATSTDGGLMYRYQDSNDFWLIRNLGGNTDFYLRSGGGYSLQAQVAGSANGDVIKAVYNGSSHTIYRNGTSIATLTDSTFSTAQLVGIRGNSGTVLWDDLKTVPA